MIITASQLQNLLEILYVLILDYRENGKHKASKEFESQLKQLLVQAERVWSNELPILPDTIRSSIKGGDSKITNLALLGHEIKEQFKSIKMNESFTGQELDALKAAAAYLRTDSETAMRQLIKLAGVVGSQFVSVRMRPEVSDQGSTGVLLKKLVQQMVGRPGTSLTTEESAVAKETYPEEYKEYLKLRRMFNQSWKDALVNFVRDSGKSLVKYQDARDYLDANGIEYSLTDGFDGLIDDQGRFYTKKGELINGVPAAVNFPSVVMNPDYPKSPWVFQTVRTNGNPGAYFYTVDFSKRQAKIKFEKVDALSDKMEAVRKKWYSLVRNFDMNRPETVAAVILELLYEFSARVGTPNNPTYGIGTLLVKHAKFMSNGDVVLAYKGKDGVPHRHVLKASDPQHKPIIYALQLLVEDKDPKERIFTSANKTVGPAVANMLFKRLTGMPDITVHKIRTYRGTKLFKQLMEPEIERLRKKSGLNEKMVLESFKGLAEKVGKLLNHVRRGATGTKVTGMTAIQSYIDPTVSTVFFRTLGVRPPKIFEKFDT